MIVKKNTQHDNDIPRKRHQHPKARSPASRASDVPHLPRVNRDRSTLFIRFIGALRLYPAFGLPCKRVYCMFRFSRPASTHRRTSLESRFSTCHARILISKPSPRSTSLSNVILRRTRHLSQAKLQTSASRVTSDPRTFELAIPLTVFRVSRSGEFDG